MDQRKFLIIIPLKEKRDNIVMRAWEFVTEFPSLKKLNFIPSLFGMTWLFLILCYQVIFTYVIATDKKDIVLEMVYNLLHQSYATEIIIFIVITFLVFLVGNPIAKGGIIQMIHTYRSTEGKKYHRAWQGFFDGLSHFLPVFEAQNLMSIFSPLTIVTSYIFLLRVFGMQYFSLISGVM